MKLSHTKKAELTASAIEYLQECLPANSTVYLVNTHTSQSGMSRRIKCLAIIQSPTNTRVQDISYFVAHALQWSLYQRGDHAVIVKGCGMDLGFHLVHSLAAVLNYQTQHQDQSSNAGGLNYQWL